MTETSNSFRDDAAPPIESSQLRAGAANPYRPPEAASGPPEPSEVSAKGPLLPAIATILFGQIPFYGALATDIAMETALPGYTRDNGAVMVVCFFLAGENLTFNARALCSGPGPFLPRAATVFCCLVAACFAAGWIGLLTDRSSIGPGSDRVALPAFSANLVCLVPLALVPALLVRACGSFDLPGSGPPRFWRGWDRLLVAASALLAVVALVPALLDYEDFVEGFSGRLGQIFPRELAQAAFVVPLALLALVGQTWRLVIRGGAFRSIWKAVPVALSIAAQAIVVGIALTVAVIDREPDLGGTIAIPLCFFVIPIVRETVIRFAGYRAVNLYVERRKARKLAAEAASNDARPA